MPLFFPPNQDAEDSCKASPHCSVKEENHDLAISLGTILPGLFLIGLAIYIYRRFYRQQSAALGSANGKPVGLTAVSSAQPTTSENSMTRRMTVLRSATMRKTGAVAVSATVINGSSHASTSPSIASAPSSPTPNGKSVHMTVTEFGVSDQAPRTWQEMQDLKPPTPEELRRKTLPTAKTLDFMRASLVTMENSNPDVRDRLRRMFALMDADDNGVISFDEFFSAVTAATPEVTISESEALELFGVLLDGNTAAFATLEEWLAAVPTGPKVLTSNPVDMQFENLSCFYKDKKTKQEKQVLFDITGSFPAGDFVALMGPSGAGKSTVMDILAMRKTTGRLTGKILINGEPQSKAFLKHSAYVTQEDLFLPTQTVMETMMYYANLRTTVSKEEKVARCERILHEVGLWDQRGLNVGGPLPGGIFLRGLSGGQKRRLAIATGLIADPSVLFLDECTSGLDSGASLQVMTLMRKLSRKGITIICTIHQVRSWTERLAFTLFPRVYLTLPLPFSLFFLFFSLSSAPLGHLAAV